MAAPILQGRSHTPRPGARSAGGTLSRFDRATRAAIVETLLARDGSACGICRTALAASVIDPDHPAATTIDRIVPIRRGRARSGVKTGPATCSWRTAGATGCALSSPIVVRRGSREN
jgi:hypothetical protein